MINSGMDVDVALAIGGLCASLLVQFPSNVLVVIGQRDIEVEGFVPLGEAKTDKGMLPCAVLYPEYEVPRRIKNRLHRALPSPRLHEASCEQLPCVRVLQTDLAPILARNDPESARPNPIGLQPLPALVPTRRRPGTDLIDRHLAHHQQRVFQGLLFLKRHRLFYSLFWDVLFFGYTMRV